MKAAEDIGMQKSRGDGSHRPSRRIRSFPAGPGFSSRRRPGRSALTCFAILLLLLVSPSHAQEAQEAQENQPSAGAATVAATGGTAASGGGSARGVRIKEIADIQGIRTNQLVGFGIVTGLEGTGDSTRSELMKKLIANFVASFDVEIGEDEIQSKNSAAVMVTSDTPPFARSGQRIDVTVSSLQDARSLAGGVLLQTPLKAANGTVYAVAQGQVVSSTGEDGNGTVGRVVEGALIEREIVSRHGDGDTGFSLLLKNPDFTTAFAVFEAVSAEFPDINVTPVDASKIRVNIPEESAQRRMEIISKVENLRVVPDTVGKVVINPASGVVVMGTGVRIGPVSVSYDSAELEVGPFSPSQQQGNKGAFLLESTTTVGDLVSILKEAGLSIDDIIEIVKTIERAGALYGTLEVM